MPQTSPAAKRSSRRIRFLTAIRNAAVSIAITADTRGEQIVVDPVAFKRLTRAINRLMDFEDDETT
jgi:hypothetical protein